ncbi:hypothetical protein HI914_07319 [Erysiphe necator]|nr:hypothetical protein HI914_07319 [Erysiphe necator]
MDPRIMTKRGNMKYLESGKLHTEWRGQNFMLERSLRCVEDIDYQSCLIQDINCSGFAHTVRFILGINRGFDMWASKGVKRMSIKPDEA